MTEEVSKSEISLLTECIQLAKEALDAGDQPFGSVLVNEENEILARARNRVNEKDHTAHPEIKLARWAASHIDKDKRKNIRVFTTGEHCPMCAAAHGWVGLGEILYIHSGKQLSQWLNEFDAPPAPIQFYAVDNIVKDINVRGPVSKLIPKMKELHRRYYNELG